MSNALAHRLVALLDRPRVRMAPWLDRMDAIHGRWATQQYARWRRGGDDAEPELQPSPRLLLEAARRAVARRGDAALLQRLIVDAANLVAEEHLEQCEGIPNPSWSDLALDEAAKLQDLPGRDPDPLDHQRTLRARWVWAATRWRHGDAVGLPLSTELIDGMSVLVVGPDDARACAPRLRICVRNLAADLIEADRTDEALGWHRVVTATLLAASSRQGMRVQLVEARREFAQLALDVGEPILAQKQLKTALSELLPSDLIPAEQSDLHALYVEALQRSGAHERAARHMEVRLQELSLRRDRSPWDVQLAFDEAWWCGQLVQLLVEQDRGRDALPWARSSVQIAERLAMRHSRDPWPHNHCAWQTAWLAWLFLDQGRDKPARTWLRRAMERAATLPAETPQRIDLRAWLFRMDGNLLARAGRLEDAELALNRSLEIAVDADRRVRLARAAAWAYEDLARLYGSKRLGPAIRSLRRAIRIWEDRAAIPQGERDRELARCYRGVAELHAARGESELAWRYRHRADELEAQES